MSTVRYPYCPDYAIAPGESLRETMTELGLDVAEVASRSGLPEAVIGAVLDGQAAITGDIAARFDSATGVPARMWLALQRHYEGPKNESPV